MKPVLLLLFVSTNYLFAQPELEKANLAYTSRSYGSEKNKANKSQINLAIKYYLSANRNKSTLQASKGILKSYYFYGKYAVDDVEEKKKIFNNAVKLGERFIFKYPDSPGIRYWYLVNLGSWAEVYGVIAAARSGFADTMKVHSEKIIELDNEYKDGGGYFMLGVVHLRAPYVPFVITWPDKILAEELLERARGAGKETLVQKLYHAKSLYKNNKKEKAVMLLTEVSVSPPSKDNLVEDWEQILEAQDLLIKLK